MGGISASTSDYNLQNFQINVVLTATVTEVTSSGCGSVLFTQDFTFTIDYINPCGEAGSLFAPTFDSYIFSNGISVELDSSVPLTILETGSDADDVGNRFCGDRSYTIV